MCEMVDAEVGRVYDAVRNGPNAENTLFILTCDHGDGLGFHAKVSKGYLEEEASRVPTVVSWPGKVKQGVRDTRHLVSGVDVAATICDYAGAPPMPKTTIARSWRPLLEGKDTAWRDYVVCETSIGSLSACVRDLQFDIRNDPLEMKDLADDPKYAAVKKRHQANFREYVSQIEIYPGPSTSVTPQVRGRRPRANPYRAYVNWYEKIKAES
jgi:choline-sulfatase